MLGVMRSLEHYYRNYGDVLDKKYALPITEESHSRPYTHIKASFSSEGLISADPF